MIKEPLSNANPHRRRPAFLALAALLAIFIPAAQLRADEPYARSRDYDLQHSKIALRFDLDQKRVLGEVTHWLYILRGGSTKVFFDSVGLTIQSVTLNRAAIKFETSADKLIVPLPAAAKAGDKFEIAIRYEGKPAKGMYFILPDKDYPDRPRQIWTQGESEDTRYYLPTYDYPNDRLTTETILTVPASWITVSNGKLISVTPAMMDLFSNRLASIIPGKNTRKSWWMISSRAVWKTPAPPPTAALRSFIPSWLLNIPPAKTP